MDHRGSRHGDISVDGHPVADGGQVGRANGLVAQAARHGRVAVAGRRGDHPGVAVRRDDPGGPPPRIREGREGDGPPGVPAEARRGRGVVDGAVEPIHRQPTRLSLPVRFA